MSKRKCLVCKTRSSTIGLSFHSFPKDISQFNLWIEAIGKENHVVTSNSVLCSTHFKPEYLDKRIDRVKLKKGSVPTVFSSQSHAGIIDKSSDKSMIAKSVFGAKETSEVTVEPHCSYTENKSMIAKSVFGAKETAEVTVEPHCSYTESSEMQVQRIESRDTQNETCSTSPWRVKHDHKYTHTPRTYKKKLVAAYKKISQFRKSTQHLKQQVKRLRTKVTSLKDVIEVMKMHGANTGCTSHLCIHQVK